MAGLDFRAILWGLSYFLFRCSDKMRMESDKKDLFSPAIEAIEIREESKNTELDCEPEHLAEFIANMSNQLWTIQYEIEQMNGESLKESLQEVFRQVHSLKGSAQILGRKDLASTAHNLESNLANWLANLKTTRILHVETILSSYLSIFHTILLELQNFHDYRFFRRRKDLGP